MDWQRAFVPSIPVGDISPIKIWNVISSIFAKAVTTDSQGTLLFHRKLQKSQRFDYALAARGVFLYTMLWLFQTGDCLRACLKIALARGSAANFIFKGD
jgi:hypothetical protein